MATNKDKIMQAVLMDTQLMKFGRYTPDDFGSNIYEACYSENTVVATVARIVQRTSEGATERELWKEINDYLKHQV